MLKPPDPSPPSRICFVDDAEAARLLERHFGLTGALERLPGERDQNYRVELAEGGRCVFKVVAADEPVALAGIQLERDAAEQRLIAEGLLQTGDGDHRVDRPVDRARVIIVPSFYPAGPSPSSADQTRRGHLVQDGIRPVARYGTKMYALRGRSGDRGATPS